MVEPTSNAQSGEGVISNANVTEATFSKPDETRLLTDEEIYSIFGLPFKIINYSLYKKIVEAQLAKDEARFVQEKTDFGLSVHEAAWAQCQAECQAQIERIFKEIEEQSFVKQKVDPADKIIKSHRQIITTEKWWQALHKKYLKKQEGIVRKMEGE